MIRNRYDYHQKYGEILGCHRMRLFINRNNNKHYNTKTIYRIINILGIHSMFRRTRTCCNVTSKIDYKVVNVVHREFEALKPNAKRTTDVMEFRVPRSTEKIYINVFLIYTSVLSLYDRSVTRMIMCLYWIPFIKQSRIIQIHILYSTQIGVFNIQV